MNRIVEAFLRDIADIIDRINIMGKVRSGVLVLFGTSVTLTYLVSVSDNHTVWLAAFIYSAIILASSRSSLNIIAKSILYLALLSAVIGLPILLTGHSRINGVTDILTASPTHANGLDIFLNFVVRITLAPIPVIVTLYYTGWPNLARKLYRVPLVRNIALLVTILIVQLPRLMRHTLLLLLANDARALKSNTWIEWRRLSTVVGNLMISSTSYSRKLQMAIEARTFTNYPLVFKE